MARLCQVDRHSSTLDGGDGCGGERCSREITGVRQKNDAEHGTLLCIFPVLEPLFIPAPFSAAVPTCFPLLPHTTGLRLVVLMNIVKIALNYVLSLILNSFFFFVRKVQFRGSCFDLCCRNCSHAANCRFLTPK